MNFDYYKKMMNEKKVPEAADARILKRIAAEAEGHSTKVSRCRSTSRLRFARVAMFIAVFLSFSLLTVTVSGKVLYDDWLGLFRSVQAQEQQENAESLKLHASVYAQTPGLSISKEGVEIRLDRLYGDGQVLMAEFTLRREDGSALIPDEHATFRDTQNLMPVIHLLYSGEQGIHETGGTARSFRLDDGKTLSELRLLYFWVGSGDRQAFSAVNMLFDDLSLWSGEGEDFAEYKLFNDTSENLYDFENGSRFKVDLPKLEDTARIEAETGVSAMYSDLSFTLSFDLEQAVLPEWFERGLPQVNLSNVANESNFTTVKAPNDLAESTTQSESADEINAEANVMSNGETTVDVKLLYSDGRESESSVQVILSQHNFSHEGGVDIVDAKGKVIGQSPAQKPSAHAVLVFPQVMDTTELVAVEIEGVRYELN